MISQKCSFHTHTRSKIPYLNNESLKIKKSIVHNTPSRLIYNLMNGPSMSARSSKNHNNTCGGRRRAGIHHTWVRECSQRSSGADSASNAAVNQRLVTSFLHTRGGLFVIHIHGECSTAAPDLNSWPPARVFFYVYEKKNKHCVFTIGARAVFCTFFKREFLRLTLLTSCAGNPGMKILRKWVGKQSGQLEFLIWQYIFILQDWNFLIFYYSIIVPNHNYKQINKHITENVNISYKIVFYWSQFLIFII